jgi:hypothetical protein
MEIIIKPHFKGLHMFLDRLHERKFFLAISHHNGGSADHPVLIRFKCKDKEGLLLYLGDYIFAWKEQCPRNTNGWFNMWSRMWAA